MTHKPFFLSTAIRGALLLVNGFIQAGLSKARKEECNRAVYFCWEMIYEDLQSVPPHQKDWKIGLSSSWHTVRITEYRVAQLIRTIEVITMASNKKQKGKSNDFGQYEFVRCELGSEDKKTAKVWIDENTADLGSLLHDTIVSDYKFSCSFSSEHDTFTACLVGKPDNVFNAYKTLTARHKDWTIAAMTVLYKHVVMFKTTLWVSEDTTEDDGWA